VYSERQSMDLVTVLSLIVDCIYFKLLGNGIRSSYMDNKLSIASLHLRSRSCSFIKAVKKADVTGAAVSFFDFDLSASIALPMRTGSSCFSDTIILPANLRFFFKIIDIVDLATTSHCCHNLFDGLAFDYHFLGQCFCFFVFPRHNTPLKYFLING